MPAAPLILLLKSLDQPGRAQPDAGSDKKRSTRDDPRLLKAAMAGGDGFPLLKGGPGSGNFGHGGRPGQVGGSAPGNHDGARTHVPYTVLPSNVLAATNPSEGREAAREYAREHWRGPVEASGRQRWLRVRNTETDREIELTFAGIKKATSSASNAAHFKAVPALPALLRQATYLGHLPDREGRADIKANHYFGAALDLGGTHYAVRMVVRETPTGEAFYDHALVEMVALPGSAAAKAPADVGRPESKPATIREDGIEISRLRSIFKVGGNLLKALAPGERWITVRPNGPGTQGHPLLVKPAGDGSMKVVGGAGGKLNHLRLTGVRSEAEYKEEARSRVKAHKEARKRQVEQDRKDGLLASKTKAREAVRAAVKDHEHTFIHTVATALGWKEEDMRFPEEQFANLSPSAQNKAAADHGRKLMERARAAVDHQRRQLVENAERRAEAGIGEVPLSAPSPETLSVQDLAPIPSSTSGLGFAPAYDKRAAANGLTEPEREKEAASFKPPPDKPAPEGAPSPAAARWAASEAITAELATVREPGPKVDPAATVDAKAAVELLRAEKALKAARAAASAQNSKIDKARQPVEPQAYPVEVAGVAPDAEITRDLEQDLRTLRTRAFLEEVGRLPNGEAGIGRHIGVGAYNAVNAAALAAGGAALVDRSVVDVLGVAGAAQVLARRLATDLSDGELGTLREAMGRYHVDHYMAASGEALREAREWHEMAHEIEVGEAATGADLAVAQELNAKRREFTANAERTLGTALGEMEANAALVLALEQPKKDRMQVSLGKTSIEHAITQLRALGMERGDYSLERVGASTMLTVTGAGMDRMAAPVAKADMQRTRTALEIINGHKDEDGWLPLGVTRRAEAAIAAPAGVAPRLAKPLTVGPAGVGRAVEDYIGGRAADGDSPADIMAGLLSEDTMARSGDRAGMMAAIDRICPLYDGDGKLIRAEAYAGAFEGMAEAYMKRAHGDALWPIHRQKFDVDQVAVDALHGALAEHPDGVAAFKPVGELTPQDQAALRGVFAREYGRSDPAAGGMRAELDPLRGAEPEREVEDMFGRGPNPAHADWRARHDELAEKVNAPSWRKRSPGRRPGPDGGRDGHGSGGEPECGGAIPGEGAWPRQALGVGPFRTGPARCG